MMRVLHIVLMLSFVFSSPALAHRLRVFAAIDGDRVAGYGFFVGGGKPKAADWTASMAGHTIAQGQTDGDGRFSFAIPGRIDGPVTVTINSGEGHVASRTLGAERFGVVSDPAPLADTATVRPTPTTEAMVQAAVAREIAPLLERIEQMDARMRVTDVISGLCLIFGIAGIALWVRGRSA